MTQTIINFSKSGETDAVQKLTGKELNAKGNKLGLKKIDEWLANPQTDHEWDFIYRVKVEPFELSLNGEKRQIETIDFFVNANTGLYFFVENALKDNNNFELQWIEEHTGKSIGLSENRPNALVVDSNILHNGRNKEEHDKIRQNSDIRDLEVDWESITLLEYGMAFDLNSPLPISLNNHNFTYEKVFLPLDYQKKEYEWLKKRLTEWKENQKPLVIKNAMLSTKSWFSAKDNNILYIVDHEDDEEDLYDEWLSEIVPRKKFSDWDKLPYQQKINFVERHFKGKEDYKDMKNEIEAAIRAAKNGDNKPGNNPPPQNPNSNKAPKTNSPDKFPWKIIIPISLFSLAVIIIGVVIAKKKKKTNNLFKRLV